MSAADERLTALKKAYADVLLNTAKEAAARIMVSERKAQRFQRELHVVKDDALRMLLSLKHLMDFKIADAELTSLSQQKKIDELEAQLQEAEDIVNDLREELREVHSELEHVRNNNQQLVDKRHAVAQRGISEENEVHYSNSVVLPHNKSAFQCVAAASFRETHQFQKNESSKFCCVVPHMGNLYFGCPDLPSIILRRKEPELYRNGRTQRIRALEGDLLNRELSLSGEINKRKDEISAQEDTGSKEIVSVPTNSIGKLCNVKKKVLEADIQLGGWHPVPSFCVKKSRATRCRRKMIISSRNFPDQLIRTNEALDLFCSTTHPISVRSEHPDVFCATTHPISVRSDVQFEVNASKITSITSSDDAEPGLQAGPAVASKNDTELVKSAGINIMQETAESSGVTVGEADLQKANNSLPISKANECGVTKRIHSQPIHERIIKYTFQRKRKKESLSESDGVVSLEDTSKRPTLEKQRDPVKQEKSNLVKESS